MPTKGGCYWAGDYSTIGKAFYAPETGIWQFVGSIHKHGRESVFPTHWKPITMPPKK